MNQKQNPETKWNLDRLFASKRFTAALSLVLAVFAWLVVILIVDPDKTIKIPIPVDFTYTSAYYTTKGLDIVQKPSKTVNVTVRGNGIVVGSLGANDIIAYPDYSAIKEAGEYTLKLKVDPRNNKDYSIKSWDLQTVTVRLDKVITQKYSVNVVAGGVQPAEGYYMDQPVSSPAEVTLTGPETDMNRVDKVIAKVDMDSVRTESAIATCRLIYLDKEGQPVTDTYITSDVEKVEVTVPILKKKEVPLVLEYSGVPAGYNPANLNPTLSEKTILIAGAASQVDAISSISTSYIDLSKFRLGEPVICDINLPEGIRNVSNLQQVTVTFDTTGYSTKMVNVTQFSTINKPDGVTITFPKERINGVMLVGLQSELDELDETGVVAQIDASANNLLVSKGQQNIAVKIIIPSTQTVFATGTYTVLCNIETAVATQPAS